MAKSVVCRLCNCTADTFVKIFEEDGINRKLGSKIASCLQIWISLMDTLPKALCMTCCNKLNDFYEFYTKSHEVQNLLKDIYEPEKHVEKKYSKPAEANTTVTKTVQHMNQDSISPHNITDVAKDEIKYIEDTNDITSDENTVCSSAMDLNEDKHAELNIIRFRTSVLIKTENENNEEDDPHASSSLQNKCEKNPNLNDNPANPRPSSILDGYPWTCTICTDVVVENPKELIKHYELEHNQSAIFKCVECAKQYELYRSFVKHFRKHRNPKKYTCDICNKSFAQLCTLKSHGKVHSKDRPHVCDVCGKSFKNYTSLTTHNKLHLPDKDKEKFFCEICQKEFLTRSSSENHRKIHTGERNFMCDICGKTFIIKGALVSHLQSHTDERNYICQTCGRALKTARLLSRHLTIHTTTPLFKCEVCGRSFRERHRLNEHNRIHTGVLPFKCEYCGKCFRLTGCLTVHRRQHTGEKPYQCEKCSRYFTDAANYIKHMKRKHNISNPKKNKRRAESRATSVSNEASKDDLEKSAASETNINMN